MILPWPAKCERKAAIAVARRGKERARAGARRAREIERQINGLACEDRFAQAVAEQIIRGDP